MSHSPEPWTREIALDGPNVIRSANFKRKKNEAIVCGVISDFTGRCEKFTPSSEDMDRIAACVNACKGIPDENLGNITRFIVSAFLGAAFEVSGKRTDIASALGLTSEQLDACMDRCLLPEAVFPRQ